MLDPEGFLSGLEVLGFWRACICLVVAGVIFWIVAATHSDGSRIALAILIFAPALMIALGWEYSARKRE